MSNSAYIETDKDGLPILQVKSDEDRRYKLLGDLQLCPLSAFRSCMKLIGKMLGHVGGGEARIILIVHMLCYVLSACCCDTSHVSNHLDPDFI
jgi:hypothetical protein